jgi:hypothetical protein
MIGLSLAMFWLGFREGANLALMLDSIPRGGLAMYQLTKAQQGPTSNTTTALEADVDAALLWAYKLELHPLLPLVEPLWGFGGPDSASLQRLAAYRATHPSPLRAETLLEGLQPGTPGYAAAAQVVESARENDRIIAEMVAKHATSTASTTKR